MKALLSLAALVSPVLCLYLPYVSASSSPSATRQSLKPKRLRNETAKPVQVQPNKSADQVFDPYIGLVEVENLNVERKEKEEMQMSMMMVAMPSCRPTYILDQTSPPSSKPTPTPTQSPTIDDPNFGKVEGKARNSAPAAAGGSQLVMPSLGFAVLLISGFWY